MFNLGAVMGGYMDARRMLGFEEAQGKINTLRDIEIGRSKREQKQVDAQDELDRRVAERLRSNVHTAVAGGVAPPAQIQPDGANPAASGVTTFPVREQQQTLVGPGGEMPPQPAPSAMPAFAAGAEGREQASAGGPSMSPLVNRIDGPPKAQQSSDPLRVHRVRLEMANETGNPKLVEYAAGKYLTALSEDVTRLDNETKLRLAPLKAKFDAGQVDADLKQQQAQAISAVVTYRAQNLGTLLAASQLFPKSEDVKNSIEAMFPNTGGVGFGQFQVTDRQTGKPVVVTALVGKDGKPVQGPNGAPAFAIPSELASTAARASPLGTMLGKPNVDWQATNTDGGVVLSQKSAPQGQTPMTVTVGGGAGGGKPSDTRAEVKIGVDWLENQVLAKGAPGAIEGVRDEYKSYVDWAGAQIDKGVRDGKSGIRAATEVLEAIKRNIAANGRPSDLIGGPAAGRPAAQEAAVAPAGAPSGGAAAVARKFGF